MTSKEEIMKNLMQFAQESFTYITEQSQNYNITKEEADEIFELVNSKEMQIFYGKKEKLICGINFYSDIHNKINNVTDVKELLEVIKFYFVDNENSEHMQNEFTIIQALMKICIHRIWQLCYELHQRLRTTPEEALNDIIDPLEASQKILFDLVQMIKNKK
jgi:hypothetical protein